MLLGAEWLIFWLAQEVALAHPIILMIGSVGAAAGGAHFFHAIVTSATGSHCPRQGRALIAAALRNRCRG